jgi:hypothetical protein
VPFETRPSDGATERERLAAEAEDLARDLAALTANPDQDALDAYLRRLRAHMSALAAQVAALPDRGSGKRA